MQTPALARLPGRNAANSRADAGVTYFLRARQSRLIRGSRRLLAHQVNEFRVQLVMGFSVFRIERYAIDWTDFHTLRRLEMPDTLGAFVRIDLVNLDALKNRLVRALGFADIAVDTQIGNLECHAKAYFPTLPCSALAVSGCTKSRTSPPSVAISRTIVAERNMYLSDGVRNMVSTPGRSFRFIPAI